LTGSVEEIPLFPLSSVLFPGGRMPLQIYEQRYLDLVRRCMKTDSGFGLVWIASGSEISRPGAGIPSLSEWGCYARIIDWDSLPSGLLGITVEGSQRFRLRRSWELDDGLLMAEVEMQEPYDPEPVVEEWDSMVDVLTSLEQHPHVKKLGLAADHSDAWEVGCALAQLLPVDEQIKYRLLAEHDVGAFMAELDEVLNELGGLTA
jgi:Lon protease-like protein